MPRSVVINPYFDWADDRAPRTPYHETVIYEAHVRGLTLRNPDVPEELRGSYSGLASPAIIDHLTRLGVTAVELMPVHQFVPEQRLSERGLTNYWGYNTIGFFAPHNAYSSSAEPHGQVAEFKSMVRALHDAGIEVILDVVYNHTAEGGALGPTLSFRGIDNAAYYRLAADDPSRYLDYTGCGNSLNVRHPHALQLIMDSLRYWVIEMHVDGFRFDLASALARELHQVDRLSTFFELVQQDPVVSQVKLIAEPWDVGEGGYQVGKFPPLWSEWNGKYRDTVRDFWRGQPATLPEFGSRLTGSSDLYETSARRPVASVNFVTCHDGFTLADLVSYDHKHNEANGEHNADGTNDNRSELRHRRAGRRPGHHRGAGPAGAQLPGHAVLLAGRADAAGRRRARPDPARQQQRLLPGQRDLLGRLGGRQQARRPAGVHPDAGRAAARAPGVPAAPVLQRPARGRRRGRAARHHLARPVGRGDDRPRLAGRRAHVGRGVPERRGHHRAGPARRAGPRRQLPAAVQRPRRAGDLPAARPGLRARLGAGRGHRRQPDAPALRPGARRGRAVPDQPRAPG